MEKTVEQVATMGEGFAFFCWYRMQYVGYVTKSIAMMRAEQWWWRVNRDA